jgi:hypothetical protein
MPTQEAHISVLKCIYTWLTYNVPAGLAVVFGVDVPVIFAGVMGTIAGQAFAPVATYKAGLKVVFFGTLAAVYATPLLTAYFGSGYSAKGIAFFVPALVISFRKPVTAAIKKRIKKFGDRDNGIV